MFHLCTNLKLPFHFNCNIILYISQVLPLGDITMIGAVRVSPKNLAHLPQSKFRGKKWKWKFFTKVIFTTIYSRIFLKEPCGFFELFNMLLVRHKKVFVFSSSICHFQVLGGILLVVQPPIIFGGQSSYSNEVRVDSGSQTVAYAQLCFLS